MKIKTPTTDESILELIKDQLGKVSAKHGHKYVSAEHLLGVIAEEQHELLHAIQQGKGNVTTEVLSELIDIAVVCIKGARSYMHNKQHINVFGRG